MTQPIVFNGMSGPSVPPNAGKIMAAVQRALRGLDVGSTEATQILSWANSETPAIYNRDQTAYLVLGSYRDPYLRRVRAVSDQLNRRYGTYAFLIGDLTDIDIPRLPEFRVKFHITATLSDYVAAVFEQDAGGEVNELGKLGETEYFEKAYAFPARTTGKWREVSQLNATFSLLGHRLWLLRTSTRRRKLQNSRRSSTGQNTLVSTSRSTT